MKKMNLFLGITFIAGIILGQSIGAIPGFGQNKESGNSMVTKKQTFIIIYKSGADFLTGKPLSEQPLKEHGKYMLSLYKAGILRFAGGFGDNTGGAAVIEVSGEEEAKNLANQDPAVINRVFVYELHPWRLVDWEQYVKK